jgi:nucleoid DNA-binding protein
MKKPEFARRLARQVSTSPEEAADQLDQVVHDIVRKLRAGKRAAMPGLGQFRPGSGPGFEFRKQGWRPDKKGERA